MSISKVKFGGVDEGLDGVIEGIIVLDEIIEKNKYIYREVWKKFLPPVEADAKNNRKRMAYIPVVAMRKCNPVHEEFSGKIRDIPYFILILNQARENRPKSGEQKEREEKKSHCKLCSNILEKKMIISEIGNYWLTPNGYPYHMYASLLINKDDNKKQGDLSAEDIATWMKTSILLNQYIFYNTMGAGASISEHQHAQVVDPLEIKVDNEIVPYPILNQSFVSRERVNNKEDVFRLKNYPVDALIFSGSDAPYKAQYAAHILESEGHPYNILVNKNEVFVIGRNPKREISVCIVRKIGGYELSGIALLGDIEETPSHLYVKVKGAKIFSNMTHEILVKNLRAATVPLDGLARCI